MSIAVLTQVYDEMRRLAIAGSVVAGGDFRLQKLVAPLEQAAAKAPVFGKVAEAVKAVVGSKEQTSASALLELATLVNAILYTQGESGASGSAEPIETTDLGTPTTQASARVLKPLLEALTTTGSGRLELIRDAHERGAFRDLRLVKPALDALDDVYGEIADFVAGQVLPHYGKAILPELRTKFDVTGKAGHPRRLQLMHALDPDGTRPLVKQALDDGSKEVKIVAVECLGGDPEDLSYLLEQAAAKAQEVRQAAYRALSALDDDAAIAVLQKALTGRDLDLAAESIRRGKSGKLLKYVIAETNKEIDGLAKVKDKKEISVKIGRARALVSCTFGRHEKDVEVQLLKLFAQRADIAKLRGASLSGSDLNIAIINQMAYGTPKAQVALAEAHAELDANDLGFCFHAARHALPADKVFAMFSPYLTAAADEKKKRTDPVLARREAIASEIGAYGHWQGRGETEPPLDPRWLDVAVKAGLMPLVRQLARPGHAAANAFLKSTFDFVLRSAKSLDQCHEIVAAMVAAEHPEATDAFIAVLEKHAKKATYYTYWFTNLIPGLPRSAVPRLEALVADLPDKVADSLVAGIQQLREKP